MIINGHKMSRPQFAVFDGCHKIFIPVKGRERGFIRGMEKKGWVWEEDFVRIDSANDLMEMYIDSCSLRFIQQIDFVKGEEIFTDIIPQFAFTDEEGFFNEDLARKAFIS